MIPRPLETMFLKGSIALQTQHMIKVTPHVRCICVLSLLGGHHCDKLCKRNQVTVHIQVDSCRQSHTWNKAMNYTDNPHPPFQANQPSQPEAGYFKTVLNTRPSQVRITVAFLDQQLSYIRLQSFLELRKKWLKGFKCSNCLI